MLHLYHYDRINRLWQSGTDLTFLLGIEHCYGPNVSDRVTTNLTSWVFKSFGRLFNMPKKLASKDLILHIFKGGPG